MPKAIVVAGGIARAKAVSELLGLDHPFHTSTSAIKHGGACRGFSNVDLILIDETAEPLDEQVRETLDLIRLGGNGQMYRLERVNAEARP